MLPKCRPMRGEGASAGPVVVAVVPAALELQPLSENPANSRSTTPLQHSEGTSHNSLFFPARNLPILYQHHLNIVRFYRHSRHSPPLPPSVRLFWLLKHQIRFGRWALVLACQCGPALDTTTVSSSLPRQIRFF